MATQTPRNAGNGATPLNKPSIFDNMDALRKSNKEAFNGERETASIVVPGKPNKELYIRFHPDDDFYLASYVWVDSDDSRKMHYIDNPLWTLEDLQGLRAVILAPWLGCDGSLGSPHTLRCAWNFGSRVPAARTRQGVFEYRLCS